MHAREKFLWWLCSDMLSLIPGVSKLQEWVDVESVNVNVNSILLLV